MRSVRFTIVMVTASVVALPFAVLFVTWVYERILVGQALAELKRLGDRTAAMPEANWLELARSNGVWLRRLSVDGRLTFDSSNPAEAEGFSLLGGLFEGAFSALGADSQLERLALLDGEAGPLGLREEVVAARLGPSVGMSRTSTSGQTLLVSWAHALPDGATLLFVKANHRGVRQLLLARNQVVKLVLTQLMVGLLVAVVLGRWLVGPLERLAQGARAFPARAIADAPLLTRRDELGQVARAFNELAQSLEARRHATSQLAADIAHEFKNPLATIQAASELMATTREPSPQKLERLHQTVEEAVRRLQRTTEALLSEVRLETALASAFREAIHYQSWLEALLETYRADPQHLGWTFELHVSPEVGTVHLAPEAWARLLRNLLDNALVQPSSRRVVRVEARMEKEALVTEVVDFGPGVSPGNRDKVFRRFFTLRPEGAPTGTGLGLSIVQAVAQAHGGRVTLLEALEGQGAAFRVTVPQG